MKFIKIGNAYQVFEDFSVQTVVKGYRISHVHFDLYEDGRLEIYRYYTWDGATGWFDVMEIMIPSCAHDILCFLVNRGHLPPEEQAMVDETFRLLEKVEQMSRWMRVWTYMAVRRFQISKKFPQPPQKVYSTE